MSSQIGCLNKFASSVILAGVQIHRQMCSIFPELMWFPRVTTDALQGLHTSRLGVEERRRRDCRQMPNLNWPQRGTYHWEVKATNSGENRSAGSCGDGSSTTCLSCWNGVPHESYGNRRMASSICGGRHSQFTSTQRKIFPCSDIIQAEDKRSSIGGISDKRYHFSKDDCRVL